MKKIFFVLATFVAMTAVSCVQDEQPIVPPQEEEENTEKPGGENSGNEDSGENITAGAKILFNELCGNKIPDGPQKFIELFNSGDAEGSLEGWTIRKYASDATDVPEKYNICWTAPAGAKLAAGAYLVLEADQEDPTLGFNAGLSAKKGVKFELVDASGAVVDRFVRGEDADPFMEEGLPENQEASFSRVPNGTGEWAYAVPTPGAANGKKTGDIEHKK